MPAIPPPPPGFTLDVPPPPAGFKLDSESSVPPPPPGFKLDDEPNFADVVGGSSTAVPPPSLGEQFKQSFIDAGHNIKKYAWDIPTEVLDRPLKPIRESLQQGGITGDMLPDIAKQNFGRFAGGAAAGLERDVVPGLASGENVAMMGAMAANPVAGAALLSKFGGEGAKQAIAATQAPPSETPEEKGRRFAQGLGGAAMAVAPLAHVGSRFVREAVKPEPLDLSSIRPEDLGAESRVPDTATAEGTPNVANGRVAEAAAALEKFKNELPEPPPPREPVAPPEPPQQSGFVDETGFDPRIINDFNRWAELRTPKRGEWVKDSMDRVNGEPMFTGLDEPQKFDVSPGKPLEATPLDSRFARAGKTVDGRVVRDGVPNTDSIRSTFNDGEYETLPGIREVPLSEFDDLRPHSMFYAANDIARVKSLANEINASGEISPLIVAVDKNGPYILEGAHRASALNEIGAKSLPALVVREIEDVASNHAERPTPIEIQEAARQLDKLDRAAAEAPAAAEAAGADRAAEGNGPAESSSLRAADPAARGTGSTEAGAPEAGNPRDVRGPAEAGQAAPGAEGVPVEGEPDLTHRSIREFQRAANVPEYEGSRFSRSNQGIRDAVQGNEAALVERGRRAKVGEALSDEVQYALKQYTDNLVRNGGDPAEIQRNYQILAESGSAKGRQLQALQTAIDQVDHTDPAAVVQLANKVTQGKLSIQAQMDLADMAKKASKMKEASDASINKRAEAALARLEGMGEQIKRLTIKDVIGCR